MRTIFLSFCILCSYTLQSQIVINNATPYNTAASLIDNILLGGGIAASNHSFIGDSNQIGFFNGINSNVGIDSGIVLSSGSIFDILGPNTDGGTTTSFLGAGDATLDAVIAPDPTNDAAVFEFDFIPNSDTISFKYVFGSEEYLEFVNSFNDAFGFFLSGPNPTGGNYIDQNLALIPGTNTPVTINNVNDVMNSAYYIDNGDGFTPPQNTDSTVIQFDGFTTPLTALAAVNCGDTYHIKIVVADAVDYSYDSGVFLEAGSFSISEPGSINIQVTTTDVMCNGDSSGTANIYCVQGATPPYTINWNGQDPNMLLGGSYTVTITDANGFTSQSSYIINEPNNITQNINYNGFELSSGVNGGTPTYTYSWLFNNMVVGNSITYTPMQNGDYSCIVIDANGCIDTSDVFSITSIPSSISELNNNLLEIFPNPLEEETTINILNTSNILEDITLFDYSGREVKDINPVIAENTIKLRKGSLKKGMYILLIRTNNFTSKRKLIVN